MRTFKQVLESTNDSFASHLEDVKHSLRDANSAYNQYGHGHSETKKAHDKYVGTVNKLYSKHGKHLPDDVYDFHDEFDTHTDIHSYIKSKTK